MIYLIYAPSERPKIEPLAEKLSESYEILAAPLGLEAGSEEWQANVRRDMEKCEIVLITITELSLQDFTVAWRFDAAYKSKKMLIPLVFEDFAPTPDDIKIPELKPLIYHNWVLCNSKSPDETVNSLMKLALHDVPQKTKETLCFISYARNDEGFAAKITAELKENGIKTWRDKENIPAGANWDREIEKSIKKCTHVVFVATPTSVESENVQDELGLALNKGKTIIPLMVETCELPLRVHRAQWIDFRKDYEDAFHKLLENLGVKTPSTNNILSLHSDGRIRYDYKDYHIEVNEIPEAQWDFGVGFGWAYRIVSKMQPNLVSHIILKSMQGERTQENKDTAFQKGKEIIKNLIDNGSLGKEICFLWEPVDSTIKEIDCNELSPGNFRSPIR